MNKNIVKLLFPINNTDNLNFDSEIKLTNAEYIEMVNANFEKNNEMMENFVKNGFSIKNKYVSDEIPNNIEEIQDYMECEAIIYNKDNVQLPLSNSEVYELLQSSKKNILIININPNTIDYDCECDLKQWVFESNNIINNNFMSNDRKILHLPSKILKIEINNIVFTLSNCKILQDISDRNNPYKLFVLIEKIFK